MLADLSRFDEAVVDLEQAVALGDCLASAHYNLGLAYEALGRPERAEAAYRDAIACDPRLAPPHNNLAIVLFTRGDVEQAARELERFRELGGRPHPDFVRAIRERLAAQR